MTLIVTLQGSLLQEAGVGREGCFFYGSYLPSTMLRALRGSEGESDLPKVTQPEGANRIRTLAVGFHKTLMCPHSPFNPKSAALVEGQRWAQASASVSGRPRDSGQSCWQDEAHSLLLLFITTF